MTSLDGLLIRAKRLHNLTDDSELEEEWNVLCSNAKAEMIADLEEQIARGLADGNEPEPVDQNELEALEAEFRSYLAAAAAEAKAVYFQNARKKKRG